jgi:hypothetical protein
MTLKIPMVVRHVDLNDDEAVELLSSPALSSVGCWHVERGKTIATLFIGPNDHDPVELAVDAARAIEAAVPGAVVERGYQQLVSVADIAARVCISPEAVRMWAGGRRRTMGDPFPQPFDEVGQGKTQTTRIWSWPEVLAWLRGQEHLGDPEPGITYLSGAEMTYLNARLFSDWPHRAHREDN